MRSCPRVSRTSRFPATAAEPGAVDAAVHHPAALRAEADEVAAGGGQRFVVRHAQRRRLRSAAAHAIDFAGLAGALVAGALACEEGGEFATQDQHRAPVVADGQALLDPLPHRVPVDAVKLRHFFHGIAAVNFRPARIG